MAADFHELLVSGILQETHDTRSFVFEIPAPLREAFRYKAGQFLTFEVPFQGMQLRRCYSLASSPDTDAWHKVTVKRVDVFELDPDGKEIEPLGGRRALRDGRQIKHGKSNHGACTSIQRARTHITSQSRGEQVC